MRSSRPLGISLGSFQRAQGLGTAVHGEPPAVRGPPLPANWCCRKRCGHRLCPPWYSFPSPLHCSGMQGWSFPLLTMRPNLFLHPVGPLDFGRCHLQQGVLAVPLWFSTVEPLLRQCQHFPSSYPSSCRNEQLFSSPLTSSLCHVSIQSEFLLCCSSGWREQTSREPSGVL